MEKGKRRMRMPSPPRPVVVTGMPGPSRARIVSPRTYFRGRDCSSTSRKPHRIRKAELVEIAQYYPGYKSSMTISELCKLLGLSAKTPRKTPKRYKRVMQSKSGKCPSGYIRGKGRYCKKTPRKTTKHYKRVMQSPSGKCPSGYIRGKRRYCMKASPSKKRKSYAPPSPPGSPRRRKRSPSPMRRPPSPPRLGYLSLIPPVEIETEMDLPPGPPQYGVRRVEYKSSKKSQR